MPSLPAPDLSAARRVGAKARPTIAMGLLLALCAAPASAETPMRLKPGLWEQTTQMKSQSGKLEAAMQQAQAAMAAMPPERRRQMEEMMARQGVLVSPGTQKLRLCLTPEQVQRDDVPAAEGCQQTSRRSGNTWEVQFQCSQAKGGGSGQGRITMTSPTSFDGDFRMTVQAQGRSEQIESRTQGRWISADCGGLKPAAR